MRKAILVVLVLSFVLTGCATTVKVGYPEFEQANQCFLERTVDNIEIGAQMEEIIPRGSRVSFVSMEVDETLDKQIIALIEDQAIHSLVNTGFIVVERDVNVVDRLVKEGGENYSILKEYYPHEFKYEYLQGEAIKPGVVYQETKMKSADYLISYRILEAGLLYRDIDRNFASFGGSVDVVDGVQQALKVERDGLVRLHVRVQNAKTGDILFASNLTGESSDKVKREYVTQLASFHYSYFPYDYPLQRKGQKPKIKSIKPASESVKVTTTQSSSVLFGGISNPTGDFSDSAERGYHLGLMKTFSSGSAFEIGSMMTYDNFGENDYHGNWSMVTGLLVGKYNAEDGFYALAGAGLTGRSYDYDDYDSDFESGMSTAIGCGYNLGKYELLGLVRRVSIDHDPMNYITLSAGLSF